MKSYHLNLFLLGCVLFAGGQQAHAVPIEVTLAPSQTTLFAQVSIAPKRWQQIQRQKWQFVARISDPSSRVILQKVIPTQRWVATFPRVTLCKRASGQVALSFDISIRFRDWWWDRSSRRWKKNYTYMTRKQTTISCGKGLKRRVVDPFAGRRGRTLRKATRARVLRRSTRARSMRTRTLRRATRTRTLRRSTRTRTYRRRLRRSTRATTKHRAGIFRATRRPQAPKTLAGRSPATKTKYYSDDRFWKFKNFLKRQRGEQRRVKLINVWLQKRLKPRGALLRYNHVRVLLRDFDYALTRYQAAQVLRPFLPRNLTAKQLARLLKLFSFGADRARVAKLYCHRINDPQNLRYVLGVMQFSHHRREVLAACQRQRSSF
ncbi:MAG: hypothetical protein CL920_25860 [Deltaproteobacteria bacterium]|nr:hypothetical protein [Deltaproteobacteria bacterium]MBU52133.1 hypothetical protein [Deltaproteobacteria bacterium]